jgi:hypothetical protein
MSKYLTEALRQAKAEREATRPAMVAPLPDSGQAPAEPFEPQDFATADLEGRCVETLVLKHLLAFPGYTGRGIAQAIALPTAPMNTLLLR